MKLNHKPAWQEWTPVEGIKQWEWHYNTALEMYEEFVLHDVPVVSFEEFEDVELNCMERMLIYPEAKELWEQLAVLNIPTFVFLAEYHNALNGNSHIKLAKEHNDYAVIVEKQANQLIETLNNCIHYNHFVSDLDRILERSRYFQSMYENERQIVSNKTRKGLIDETYLRESLSNFFKEWTQQPRHNLVKIALNVTFGNEKTTEKVQKAIKRRQKKQIDR